MPNYFQENNTGRSSDSLERSMAKIVGLMPLALDFWAGSFYRNFARQKTLNHGVGPAITFTRASRATFFDASGTLQTAAINEPRFDHDPATGASRGLLIEESRTNLFERSAEFDNAYWSNVESSTSANIITAVDGQLAADKIIESSLPAKHFIKKRLSGDQGVSTVGQSITGSVFLKASERSKAILILKSTGSTDTDDPGNLHGECLFDLSNGQIDSVTNLSSLNIGVVRGRIEVSSVHAGDGWYRCVITVTIVSTTPRPGGWRFEVVLHNGTSISYTGDGTSGLFIWGAQLEAGAFPTSYIPTTTAAATRSADSAVVTPISSFYNQSEGTVAVEANVRFARLFAFDDNVSTDNSIRVITQIGAPRYSVVVAGSNQAAIDVGSATSGPTLINMATTYRVDDFAVSLNGASVATDTSGSVPTGLTHLRIGLTFAALSSNGHIRKIAYWPKRLSNTLLQQLTT